MTSARSQLHADSEFEILPRETIMSTYIESIHMRRQRRRRRRIPQFSYILRILLFVFLLSYIFFFIVFDLSRMTFCHANRSRRANAFEIQTNKFCSDSVMTVGACGLHENLINRFWINFVLHLRHVCPHIDARIRRNPIEGANGEGVGDGAEERIIRTIDATHPHMVE